jgi:hypothetical protein
MPIGTTAAILGAAAIGAGGSLAAGAMQSGAINDASNTATAEQKRQFDIAQANQKPWLVTGTSALNKLGAMYGLDTYQPNFGGSATGSPVVQQPVAGNINQPNVAPIGGVIGAVSQIGQTVTGQGSAPGAAPQPTPGTYTPGSQQPAVDPYADFYKSPDYAFRLGEGLKAGTAALSQAGALESGAAVKEATKYAGSLAAGEYNAYANRLAALSGVGQVTAGNMAGQGANYANNVGQIALDRGKQLASSYGDTIGNLAGIGSGLVMNLPGAAGGSYKVPSSPAPYQMNWG